MEFEKLKFVANIDQSSFEVLNSEFTKAKAYILYYGENKNKSRLSKETVEAAMPSLFNTPVVAEFVEKKEDFGTHGGKIIISDEGIEFVQTTRPYGLVPESACPRWEMVEDKEYLVADIILWSGRYAELEKTIMEFSNQSMEINVMEGSYLQAEQMYDITKFEFSALCLLGQSVEPCFEKAKVVAYGLDEFKQETDEMFKKYKEFAIVDESIEEEILEGATVQTEEFSAEVADEVQVESALEFSATYRQKRESLQNALDPKIEKDADGNVIYEEYMWVEDFDDTHVFVEKNIWTSNDHECKYGRFTYSFDNDSLVSTIGGEFEEMVLTWLTLEENQKLQDARDNFTLEINTLKEQISGFELTIGEKDNLISQLTEYKNKNEYEIAKFDIQNLIEEFEPTLVDNDEFKSLQDAVDHSFEKGELFMELDALEKELFAMVGRMKHKFNTKKQKKQNFSRVVVTEETVESNLGYFGSAEKYIKK